MAVPKCCNINAGAEIDVLISVHVAQRTAVAGLKRDREEFHLATQTLEVFCAPRVPLVGLGPRHRFGYDFWIFIEVNGVGRRIVFARRGRGLPLGRWY